MWRVHHPAKLAAATGRAGRDEEDTSHGPGEHRPDVPAGRVMRETARGVPESASVTAARQLAADAREARQAGREPRPVVADRIRAQARRRAAARAAARRGD